MKLSRAIKICLDYHRNHSKPNTVRSYEAILTKLDLTFGDKELAEISSENVLTFLEKITDGTKQQTRRTRYSHLAAFFNFIIANIDQKDAKPMCRSTIEKALQSQCACSMGQFGEGND